MIIKLHVGLSGSYHRNAEGAILNEVHVEIPDEVVATIIKQVVKMAIVPTPITGEQARRISLEP
jgi:hypothetical protein